MALATPTTAEPEVVEAPTEPPPASMGAVAKLGSLAAARESSEEAHRDDAAAAHAFDPQEGRGATSTRWSGASSQSPAPIMIAEDEDSYSGSADLVLAMLPSS